MPNHLPEFIYSANRTKSMGGKFRRVFYLNQYPFISTFTLNQPELLAKIDERKNKQTWNDKFSSHIKVFIF